MDLKTITAYVVLSAGLIFLWALILGVVKYRQMAASAEGQAHFYTDTAHRAALMYSFATILIAFFVELSDFSDTVNGVAAFVLIFFFVFAIAGYMYHGLKQDTENQILDSPRGLHAFMTALIIGEIGGFTVLLIGFVQGQLL
jgi:hypothetical protein